MTFENSKFDFHFRRCRVAVVLLLLCTWITVATSQPYVSLDWSAADLEADDPNIEAYTVDYLPNVGNPPPPIRLLATQLQTEISDTLPATMYTVAVIAELRDKKRSIIYNATIPSSPEPPLVDSIDARTTEIQIRLFPPDTDDITYLANYSLTSEPDWQFSRSFTQPSIELDELNAGSEYQIYVFTIFNGVYSHRPCHVTVKTLTAFTKALPNPLLVSSATVAPSGGSMETEVTETEAVVMTEETTTSSTNVMITDEFKTTVLEELTAVLEESTTAFETSSAGSGGPSADPEDSTVPSARLEDSTTMTAPTDTTTTASKGSTTVLEDSTTVMEISTSTEASSSTAESTTEATTTTTTTTMRPTSSPRIIQTVRVNPMRQSTGGSSWKPEIKKPNIAAEASTVEEHRPNIDLVPKKPPLGAVGREPPLEPEDGDLEEGEAALSAEGVEHELPRPKGNAGTSAKNRTRVVKPIKEDPLQTQQSFNFTAALPPEIMAKLPDSYGRPRSVEFAPEGRQLRVSWQQPDSIECSGYLVNYTLITLHVPKSFQIYVDSDRTYALIKMYLNNVIEVEVSCIQNETVVSKTPGRAMVDLRKPEAVKNLRIGDILTDDFFRSSISLEWDWPTEYAYDPEMYPIVVSYFPGNAKKLKSQTVTVNETGPVNITSLKPTETYTFSVRNISRLNIESVAKGFKQIMPPVIASTLLPGQVTSTSLLITYSPTDVDEARFDSYQLLACFSEDVNKTFVKSKADPNRNFLLKNLIPGQTYGFHLYTVYRKVRSKPVVANFTTYPLKVKNLLGIVRRNAVKLFYEPEESPLKEIRYRLSFTGSDGTESDSVTLLNQREYVFDYLKPEIWYTFAVTVLMAEQESESNARTIVTGFNSDPVAHVRGSTPTTIDIAFRRDSFTESNGIIQNYSIIVAEDYRMDYFNYSVLSWRGVQNQEVWPPFRATPNLYHPFKNPNDEAATYTIGIETCSVDGLDEYCNGPLKPRTEYFIKIRACTNENICMETSYTKAATEIDTTSLETRKFLNSRLNSHAGRPTISQWTGWGVALVMLFRYCLSSRAGSRVLGSDSPFLI